jgi:hypothetical protein
MERTIIPDNIITRIYEMNFSDLYYSSEKDQFYLRRVKNAKEYFKPVKWNEVHRAYNSKKNNDKEKIFSYKYASLPLETTHYRLSSKDWEKIRGNPTLVNIETNF